MEDWLFDGWFLRPFGDRRDALIFDGVELIDYCRENTRRWHFDGSQITKTGDDAPLWLLEGERLSRPGVAESSWLFDGRNLVQCAANHPDKWIASDTIPIVVICFAAGLL